MKKVKSKLIEDAVIANQKYAGSLGARRRDTEKLYSQYIKAVERVAKHYNMDYNDASDQIGNEASRRGPITPLPAKDY